MDSLLNIGLSGLQAASTRVAVSANNVVNLRSKPADPASGTPGFQALRVYQEAVDTGGVRAGTRPVNPGTIQTYNPYGGANGQGAVERLPNVSLEREAVEQISAKHAYEASAKIIKTADEMSDTLLDIIS